MPEALNMVAPGKERSDATRGFARPSPNRGAVQYSHRPTNFKGR